MPVDDAVRDPRVDVDRRVAQREAGDEVGQHLDAEVGRRGDLELSRRLLLELGQRAHRRAQGVQVRRGPLEQRLAGRRQRDLARRAVDELAAELLLEARDAARDRALGQTELRGGGGEAAGLGKGHELLEDVEGDCCFHATPVFLNAL
jgi:hypothetical protein